MIDPLLSIFFNKLGSMPARVVYTFRVRDTGISHCDVIRLRPTPDPRQIHSQIKCNDPKKNPWIFGIFRIFSLVYEDFYK